MAQRPLRCGGIQQPVEPESSRDESDVMPELGSFSAPSVHLGDAWAATVCFRPGASVMPSGGPRSVRDDGFDRGGATIDLVARLDNAPTTARRGMRGGLPSVMTEVAAAAPASTRLSRQRMIDRLGARWPRRAAGYLLAFCALTALFYLTARTTTSGDSDVATLVLQGQSVDHGHVLLDGWRMGVDSFWTIEVPFYALGVAIIGVQPVLLFLVPAMFAAAVVLAGAAVARQGLPSRPGLWGGPATLSVGIFLALVALPCGVWAWLFLRGGWHVATTLWCLIAFWAVRRGRWGRGVVVAAIFIALGLLGDLQTAPLGIAPLVAAGLVAMARTRSVRGGLPVLSAGVGGGMLALLIRYLVGRAGGLQFVDANPSATATQRAQNVRNLPSWFTQAFGTGNGYLGTQGVPAPLAALHIIGAVAVMIALIAALIGVIVAMLRGTNRGTDRGTDRIAGSGSSAVAQDLAGPDGEAAVTWRLNDLLLLGAWGDLAFFVIATLRDDPGYLRYLTPAVIFGSLLTARLGARSARLIRWPAWRRVIAVCTVVVFGLYGSGFIATTARPQPANQVAELIDFLTAHQLTSGLGNYWLASLTTVYAHDRVKIRPVLGGGGAIVRYRKQNTSDWYAGKTFQFVAYQTTTDTSGVNDTNAAGQFGPIAEKFYVGTFRVLVWTHPLTLSAQ